MSTIKREKVVDLVKKAMTDTLLDLYNDHDEEDYYYFGLVVSGELARPIFSTWSIEALKREAEKYYNKRFTKEEQEKITNEPWSQEALQYKYFHNISYDEIFYELKWSLSSSPYFAYKDDKYFKSIEKLFDINIDISDDEYLKLYNFYVACMEIAINDLNQEDIFLHYKRKEERIVNVVVADCDEENIERVKRLNSKKIIEIMLSEISKTDGCF